MCRGFGHGSGHVRLVHGVGGVTTLLPGAWSMRQVRRARWWSELPPLCLELEYASCASCTVVGGVTTFVPGVFWCMRHPTFVVCS